MPLTITTQFSVFLVNKPGVLALVTRALAREKINLVAVTLVDSQEHGVLRFVPGDPAAARAILAKLNLPTTETDVLCMELSNRPGALADVAAQLGEAHININYAYCTSGAPGGHTTAVLKVADLNKAERLFQDSTPKHREPNLRRPSARR